MSNNSPENNSINNDDVPLALDHTSPLIKKSDESNLIISPEMQKILADLERLQELSITVNVPSLRQSLLSKYYKFVTGVGMNETPAKIEVAPGYNLVRLLQFLCRKKTIEFVIEPMHAEFLTEYFDALKQNKKKKALLIKCQMHFFLVAAVVGDKVLGMIRDVIGAPFKAKSDDS